MADKDDQEIRYRYVGARDERWKKADDDEDEFPDLPENPLLRNALPEPTREGGFLYYQFYTRVVKTTDQSPAAIALIMLKLAQFVVFFAAALSTAVNRMTTQTGDNFFGRVLGAQAELSESTVTPIFHTAFYLLLLNVLICVAGGVVNAYTIREQNDRLHPFFVVSAAVCLVMMVVVRGLLWQF